MFAAVATLSTIGCLLLMRNSADQAVVVNARPQPDAPVPDAMAPNRPTNWLQLRIHTQGSAAPPVPLLKRAERPKRRP